MPEKLKQNRDIRVAVLIDADNVSYQHLQVLMPEVARYGLPTIKRIYGDWTSPNLNGWKKQLQDHAIIPIQQFSYTTGKNATDSALIIDAMDLLYSERVDAFCLVSSDSDFTRLATRLREAGRTVYGIGERKTPKPFIAACDKFTYFEVLQNHDMEDEENLPDSVEASPTTASLLRGRRNKATNPDSSPEEVAKSRPKNTRLQPKSKDQVSIDRKSRRLITRCIDDLADEEGWSYLGEVGNLLMKMRPDFDARNYGCAKLSQLIQSLEGIEVSARPGSSPGIKLYYVRNQRTEEI